MKKLFIAAMAVLSVSAFADYNSNNNSNYNNNNRSNSGSGTEWQPVQGRFTTDRNNGAQCWMSPDGTAWYLNSAPAPVQQYVTNFNDTSEQRGVRMEDTNYINQPASKTPYVNQPASNSTRSNNQSNGYGY